MIATDSPISCELSPDADRDGLSLKTCPDCLMHPVNLAETPVHSLETYCDRFPKSGTWGNGWFLVQPALDCPTIESDCLLLPTPTALSSRNSRPPGQNKLEVKLKQLGLIQRGEVANPELLETMFGLPMGYSFPLELIREIPSLADDAKHSEIPSAENVRSQPSEESYTSIPLVVKKVKESGGKEYGFMGDEISPRKIENEKFLGDKLNDDISPRKIRRTKGDGSGSIYYRTVMKKGKEYREAYYHYEFWSGGDRLIKSSRYIPKKLLAQVQQLDAEKAPVRQILQVLGVVV
jgi:hypothetical protein